MLNKYIKPFTADQLRLLVDADNHYRQYLAAKRAVDEYAGWMRWRTQKGTDYLISGKSGGEQQQSHGVRSTQTEALFENFQQGKARAKQDLEAINTVLAERAAQMKALRMGRIPHAFAKVLRHYDVSQVLGEFLLVGGTHALYCYEALAGCWLDSALSATDDLDLVWCHEQNKIELLATTPPVSLLKYLKDIDETFTVNQENRFQVRNNKGLVIDFLASEASGKTRPREYLNPIALTGQDWLMLLPTVASIVIDTQGYPVQLYCPDPRLFALHKTWLSQRTDRSPLKTGKDQQQAIAVAALTQQYLRQYPFNSALEAILPAPLQEVYNSLPKQHDVENSQPDKAGM